MENKFLFAYSVNSDGLTPLDVASLSNNRSMTKILLQHGALQGPQSSSESLGNYLSSLMFDAEQKVQDLAGMEDNPPRLISMQELPSPVSLDRLVRVLLGARELKMKNKSVCGRDESKE
jgi:hypothetical protein